MAHPLNQLSRISTRFHPSSSQSIYVQCASILLTVLLYFSSAGELAPENLGDPVLNTGVAFLKHLRPSVFPQQTLPITKLSHDFDDDCVRSLFYGSAIVGASKVKGGLYIRWACDTWHITLPCQCRTLANASTQLCPGPVPCWHSRGTDAPPLGNAAHRLEAEACARVLASCIARTLSIF